MFHMDPIVQTVSEYLAGALGIVRNCEDTFGVLSQPSKQT